MAKIIITRDAQVLKEVLLVKERMTLGRHPENDIVIEHGAVSARHAAITTILDDAFLEDLGSTNGTYVNGQRIAKHVLTERDQITVAKYQLQFIGGALPVPRLGQIEVLNGANAGKRLPLAKPLTTLGRPGHMVVVITRNSSAYAAAHIEGDHIPTLNGQPLNKTPRILGEGDVLDLAGTKMAFSTTPA